MSLTCPFSWITKWHIAIHHQGRRLFRYVCRRWSIRNPYKPYVKLCLIGQKIEKISHFIFVPPPQT